MSTRYIVIMETQCLPGLNGVYSNYIDISCREASASERSIDVPEAKYNSIPSSEARALGW